MVDVNTLRSENAPTIRPSFVRAGLPRPGWDHRAISAQSAFRCSEADRILVGGSGGVTLCLYADEVEGEAESGTVSNPTEPSTALEFSAVVEEDPHPQGEKDGASLAGNPSGFCS